MSYQLLLSEKGKMICDVGVKMIVTTHNFIILFFTFEKIYLYLLISVTVNFGKTFDVNAHLFSS